MSTQFLCNSAPRSGFSSWIWALPFAMSMAGTPTWAANQTATTTPLAPASQLPYRIEVRPFDFGSTNLPTLHSYAAAEYDGKWVLLSGRTNGLHGFENGGRINFPEAFQNRDVWVIDPVAKQSWSRSLEGAGLEVVVYDALTSTNNQFYQQGDQLYVTGGYGAPTAGGFTTYDTLSSINLPGIVDWVTTGTGSVADSIRFIQDDAFKVTGGAMYEIDGKTHLVFGQDFNGGYNPNTNGAYTNQVRTFEIVDDGVNLSITNETASTPEDHFRRRDLNIFPVTRPDGNGGELSELVVLSGVFTDSFGAWTVPVEIDAQGNPTQVDYGNDPLNVGGELDADSRVFKQGFNGYHAAKLGLYSESTGTMSEVLFGGISLQFLDETTGQLMTDQDLPFVNDITSVVIDADGNYSQHHLGFFPELVDDEQNRLRFGANAEFFRAPGIDAYENNVIQLDAISGETVLGHIFGGIMTNGPHTRQGADSAASSLLFEVVLIPVPEPATGVLLLACGTAIALGRGRPRA